MQDSNKNVNTWDLVDFGVATLAVAASVALMFTPVGWIATAALITTAVGTGYFSGRLIQDLVTD